MAPKRAQGPKGSEIPGGEWLAQIEATDIKYTGDRGPPPDFVIQLWGRDHRCRSDAVARPRGLSSGWSPYSARTTRKSFVVLQFMTVVVSLLRSARNTKLSFDCCQPAPGWLSSGRSLPCASRRPAHRA